MWQFVYLSQIHPILIVCEQKFLYKNLHLSSKDMKARSITASGMGKSEGIGFLEMREMSSVRE